MRTYEHENQWGETMRVRLLRGAYADGGLAVQMPRLDEDGEWGPWATVTTNLGDTRNQSGSLAYVDANSCPGAASFLEENGLATWTGASRGSGFCTYPLYAFTDRLFAECGEM